MEANNEVVEGLYGTYSLPRDPRVIAEYEDGKSLVIDCHGFPRSAFRKLLTDVLTRKITEESRQRILRALCTPKTEGEMIEEEIENAL